MNANAYLRNTAGSAASNARPTQLLLKKKRSNRIEFTSIIVTTCRAKELFKGSGSCYFLGVLILINELVLLLVRFFRLCYILVPQEIESHSHAKVNINKLIALHCISQSLSAVHKN